MKSRFDLRIEENLLKDIRLKSVHLESSVSDVITRYILLGISLERLNSINDGEIKKGDIFQSIMADLEDEYQ